MRPPSNAYIYPVLQRHISRRSASKDNDNNNDRAIKHISCHHLWEQYYKCIKHESQISTSCKELHDKIILKYECPIWEP
jgi:hypothetical protein